MKHVAARRLSGYCVKFLIVFKTKGMCVGRSCDPHDVVDMVLAVLVLLVRKDSVDAAVALV